MVPEPPVVRSVTVTWYPSLAEVVNQWMVIMSPAFITRGFLGELESVSIALNAAVSWNFPGVPCAVSFHTGEQTVYVFGEYFTTNPPCGVQLVTSESGYNC